MPHIPEDADLTRHTLNVLENTISTLMGVEEVLPDIDTSNGKDAILLEGVVKIVGDQIRRLEALQDDLGVIRGTNDVPEQGGAQ
jgi:hypothetical protein